jgi:hypothetical protein
METLTALLRGRMALVGWDLLWFQTCSSRYCVMKVVVCFGGHAVDENDFRAVR